LCAVFVGGEVGEFFGSVEMGFIIEDDESFFCLEEEIDAA